MNFERSISPSVTGKPSPGDAVLIEHIFIAGETLSGIANYYYGDWRMWRLIAIERHCRCQTNIPARFLMIPEQPLEMEFLKETNGHVRPALHCRN
jgi:hypothetical protein